MEGAGTTQTVVRQPIRSRDTLLQLPLEPELQRLDRSEVIKRTSYIDTDRLTTILTGWQTLFDEHQLSFPIESQFEGIYFRSSTRDPRSHGLATPLDSITKLPLPIMVIEAPNSKANVGFSDYHHHYHPERDLIHADDATLALRRSRGQTLPRWLHERYHHYFAGPEFPFTRQETFASVVLACAGVVPRRAIDLSDQYGPQIVEITDNRTYQKIVSTVKHEGEKKTSSSSYYRAQIGIFFANYAIEQSFEEVVSQKVINEFLNTHDTQRRKILGNLMLREAINLSLEPVLPLHQSLKEENIWLRRKTDLRDLVKDYFVRSRQPDYYQAMDHKLSIA